MVKNSEIGEARELVLHVATDDKVYEVRHGYGGITARRGEQRWDVPLLLFIESDLSDSYQHLRRALKFARQHDVADARTLPDGSVRLALHATYKGHPCSALYRTSGSADDIRAVLGY